VGVRVSLLIFCFDWVFPDGYSMQVMGGCPSFFEFLFEFLFRVSFMFGFAKNQQDNISPKELKALKAMAKQVLGYTPAQLNVALNAGEFIEVKK
jgi:hypothetical protein